MALGLGNFMHRAATMIEYVNAFSVTTGGTDEYIRVEGDTANQAIWPNASGANRGWSKSFWVKCRENVPVYVSTPQNAPSFALTFRYNGNMGAVFYGGRSSSIYQNLNLNAAIVPGDNSLSDWVHIVVTFNLADADSSIVCYADGVEYSVAAGNSTYASTGTWTAVTGLWDHTDGLGGSQGDTVTYSYAGGSYKTLEGLDEISIYDEVLDQTQVNSLYNSGTPTSVVGVSDYLTAWWKMGDGDTHPTLADSSGNGYDLAMKNMESGDIQEDVPPS